MDNIKISLFETQRIFDLFAYLKKENIDSAIAYRMIKELFVHPKLDFESILTILKFKKKGKEDVLDRIKVLHDKFSPARKNTCDVDKVNSIMGQLRSFSEGNINLADLYNEINTFSKK